MTLSESKWARQDDSPVAPISKETINSSDLNKTEVTVSKTAPLVSRWATAEHNKNDIPTPPHSGGSKNEDKFGSEKSIDNKLAGLNLQDRIGTPSGPKLINKDSSKKNHQLKDKDEGAHKSQPRPKKSNQKENSHQDRTGKQHETADDNDEQKHREATHNKNTVNDKGPMTAGARSLAMRIGVPDKKDNTRSARQPVRGKTQGLNLGNNNNKNQNQNHNHKKDFGRQNPGAKSSPPSRRDVDDVDETIKAEVQAMFEKMSDKSTSWADIEDWADVED